MSTTNLLSYRDANNNGFANHNTIDGFCTVAFIVACVDGTHVDAATGTQIGDAPLSDDHTDFVKHTCQRYITTVCDMNTDVLRFMVYAADRVNKTGLCWECIGIASFSPHLRTPQWLGEKTFDYWFSGTGRQFCVDGLLIPSGKPLTPEKCYSKLWRGPIPEQIEDISMRDFIQFWRNGTLQRLYSDSCDPKKQHFGVEIEFTGMTQQEAAAVVSDCLDNSSVHYIRSMNGFCIRDNMGRPWHINNDASITPENEDGSVADTDHCCELVTPICNYSDISTIQSIVNHLRAKGMRVNNSCGVHVHVDDTGHTAATLRSLVNTMRIMEHGLFVALGIEHERRTWCQSVDSSFANQINARSDAACSLSDIKAIWYAGSDSEDFISHTRNHALNLASMWQGKGVEFRMFNSTTVGKVVKGYVQLCLAINIFAKHLGTLSRPDYNDDQDYDQLILRWLDDMGMNKKEYAGVRQLMIENLNQNRLNRRTA